jgi:hypothetical protein
MMTKQEIYNEVKAEFATMTLPAPYIPPEIANAKISAYNAYKSWLENNKPLNSPNDSTDADVNYFQEIYNNPY